MGPVFHIAGRSSSSCAPIPIPPPRPTYLNLPDLPCHTLPHLTLAYSHVMVRSSTVRKMRLHEYGSLTGAHAAAGWKTIFWWVRVDVHRRADATVCLRLCRRPGRRRRRRCQSSPSTCVASHYLAPTVGTNSQLVVVVDPRHP